MRDHTRLKAFKLADQLTLDVYAATCAFPEEERFGLSAQMRRAAVSVGANIVEAAARPSEAEYLRLLTIAYGSAKELQYEISLSVRLRYMRDLDAEKLTAQASESARVLWALIAAIRRSSGSEPARRP